MDLVHDETKALTPRKPSGALWFSLGGVGLLAAAGGFLWLDMRLDPQYLLAVAAAIATVGGLARFRTMAIFARAVLLACCVGGAAAYAALRTDPLLVGLAVAAAGATVHALFSYIADDPDRVKRTLTSHTFAAAALLCSWGLYFRFITLGVGAEHVGRRMALTLAWLVAGIALVAVRSARTRWHAGYLFVIAAFGKALCYDTVYLGGALRIATLGLAGLLLLVGAWLLGRGPQPAGEGAR